MFSAALLAAVLVQGACTSDKKSEPCPAGAVEGAKIACQCGSDASAMAGFKTCQKNLTLTGCECPGTDLGDGGLPPTHVTGGAGGSGGTSPGTGGSGGTGGTTGGGGSGGDAPVDGGIPMSDAGPPPVTIPTDGNKLSVCKDGRDCNKGLDCVKVGTGVGFCSPTCASDADCTSLTGATFTCSSALKLCAASCSGTSDMDSCPDGMICIMASGGFPLPATFTCQWPVGAGDPPPMTEKAFGMCRTDMACKDGMSCQQSSGPALPGTGAPGYCTQSCKMTTDCTEKPGSGTISPTCQPSLLGDGVCSLDCFGSMSGCPSGMSCKVGLGYARCEF